MKKEILLSIICPVYNGGKSIGKIIESLEEQDYKDYELLLVDDGSTDDTLKILRKYEKKYKNIIVIDKKHSSVGDTRNMGIERSSGKYITFGDADDWYSEDFFEKIIPHLKEGNFELLVFNAYVMDYDKFMYDLIPAKYKTKTFTEENGVYEYLKGKFGHQIGNVPWNKIYLKEIITKNNLKFDPDKKRGQDLLFNILYVSKIKNYKYINEKLYYYELNMNPLTTREYRPINIPEKLKYYHPIQKICEDNHLKNWEHYLGLFYLRRVPGVIINESNNPDYKTGKENIEAHLHTKEINYILKKVKLRNMDFKLFASYLLYKFKLYKPAYYLLWHHRH